jgi:collagen triple helix repeat protein
MNRAARSSRAARSHGNRKRGWSTPSILLAGTAVFVVLSASAVAANGLIHAGDIAPGAVASKAIRDGAVQPRDLSASMRAFLEDGQAVAGAQGDTGPGGTPGSNGANGPNGANGANGANGIDGTDGSNGAEGTKGSNGANGINGVDGTDGTDGIDGVNGSNGTNGTVAPLSATKGLTPLPTASPPTTVVELAVPAGNYVVLAKTQLSHTGAGDSVECTLKGGATAIDQIAMKTLPALAAIPASLQAVTTTSSSSTVLSVQCSVLVANGAANFSSLIAIPTA